LNQQLRVWLDTVANARVHGTTGRIVAEHFAEEGASLKPLLAGRFDAVLQVERRVSHEGMVSVGGNLFSVPDGTRRRALEVEITADQVRIHEDGQLIAVHVPVARPPAALAVARSPPGAPPRAAQSGLQGHPFARTRSGPAAPGRLRSRRPAARSRTMSGSTTDRTPATW